MYHVGKTKKKCIQDFGGETEEKRRLGGQY